MTSLENKERRTPMYLLFLTRPREVCTCCFRDFDPAKFEFNLMVSCKTTTDILYSVFRDGISSKQRSFYLSLQDDCWKCFCAVVFVISLLMEFEGLRENKKDLVFAVSAKSLLIELIASPRQGRSRGCCFWLGHVIFVGGVFGTLIAKDR